MTDIIIQKKGIETILSQGKNKSELLKLSGKPITIKSTRQDNIIELEKSLKITGHDFIIDSQRRNSKLSIMGTLNINNSYVGELNINSEGKNTIEINDNEIKFNKFKFNQSLDKKSTPEFFGLELNNSRITNLGFAKHKYDAVNKEFMEEYVESKLKHQHDNKIESIKELKAFNKIIFDAKVLDFKNADFINIKEPEKGGKLITKKYMNNFLQNNQKDLSLISKKGPINFFSENSEFNFNSKRKNIFSINYRKKNIIFDNLNNNYSFLFKNNKNDVLRINHNSILFNKKIIFSEDSQINEIDGDLEFFTENDIILNTEKNIQINQDATLRFGNDSFLFSKESKYFKIFSKEDINLDTPKDIYFNSEKLKISGLLTANLDINSQKYITNLGLLKGLNIDTTQIVDFGGNTINNIGEPYNDTDATTKKYVDTEIKKIEINQSAKVVEFKYLDASYIDITTKLISNNFGQLVIDDYVLSANDRIVVAGQIKKDQNGIYTVTKIGSSTTRWELTRASDFNDLIEINPNVMISIEKGTLHQDSLLAVRSDKIEGISGDNTLTNYIEFVKYSGLGASAVDNILTLKQILKTPDPIAEHSKIYIRDDGKIYLLDSNGVETCLLDNNNTDQDNEINIWNMMDNDTGISYTDLIFKGKIKEKFHIDNHISFTHLSQIPISEDNQTKLYVRDDGKLYFLDNKGIETCLIDNIIDNDNEINVWNMTDDDIGTSYVDLNFKGKIKEKFHIDNHISFTYLESSPTAENNQTKLFSKNDGKLYIIDQNGNESSLIKDNETNASIAGNLTLGSTTSESDLKIFGNSSTKYFFWDGSENTLTINDNLDVNVTSKSSIFGYKYQTSTPSSVDDQLNVYSKNDGNLYSVDNLGREKKIKSMLTNDINPSVLEITLTTNNIISEYNLYKNTEYAIKIHKIIASTTIGVTGVSDMDIINSTTGNTIVDNTYFDPTISNSSFYYQSNGTLSNDSINQNDQIAVKFDAIPTNSVNVKFLIYFVLT
jgi:hypothetical protein